MITNSDALDFTRAIPADSVDLVLTDPAYDSLDRHVNPDAPNPRLTRFFKTVDLSYLLDLMTEFSRVLKPGRHCYVMADWTLQRQMPDRIGNLEIQNVLIWDKGIIGMGYHWRKTYEMILFYAKDGPNWPLIDPGKSDILRHSRLTGKQYYPTQKPIEMFREIITNSSAPGEIVLDPFSGAGTAAAAAVLEGREYLACDADAKAVERGNAWISGLRGEQLVLLPK